MYKCHVVGEKYVKIHKKRCHRYQSHRRVSTEILKKFSNCNLSNYFIHLNTQIHKQCAVSNKEFLKEYCEFHMIVLLFKYKNKVL